LLLTKALFASELDKLDVRWNQYIIAQQTQNPTSHTTAARHAINSKLFLALL
jgi:hypothetical protein